MPRAPLALLLLGAVAHADPLTFTRRDFDSQNPGQVSEGMNVGDLDGDGRPDIVGSPGHLSIRCARAFESLRGSLPGAS